MDKNVVAIVVGEMLFEFSDFRNWCDTAKAKFAMAGAAADNTICIDNRCRVVNRGGDFMRAQEDGAFPVKVYRYRSTERGI